MKHFPIKRDDSGRALLNLACGTRTDWSWNNLDFSPYATLRRYPLLAGILDSVGFLSEERLQRLESIDPEIIRWNLARGIPFSGESFDVVYHSHFLEHLDRGAAIQFLKDCYRILKPGGVLRIVVPDLELLVRRYWQTAEDSDGHELAIVQLFDQMVRTEPSGANEQKRWVGRIEKLFRGSAGEAGEAHRWMYDWLSLTRILSAIGFEEIVVRQPETSAIANWKACSLDVNSDGTPYKADSLYIEARKLVRMKLVQAA